MIIIFNELRTLFYGSENKGIGGALCGAGLRDVPSENAMR
jgi:hypothetical protein